jgi:hypothetical protein
MAVADAAVVFVTADQDADGFVVVLAAEHVIDKRDIEVELACELGLELARLQFDDYLSVLVHVEKQHVDVVVIAVDVEVHLPANESEPGPQFPQRFRYPAGQGQFQVPFSNFAGEARNSKLYGSFAIC